MGSRPPFAGDPISLWTGYFEYKNTDVWLADAVPVELTRHYYSGHGLPAPFGIGTTHTYESYLAASSMTLEKITLIQGDGVQIPFERTAPGIGFFLASASFANRTTPGPFLDATLVYEPPAWVLRRTDGRVLRFSATTKSRMTSIEEPDGRRTLLLRDAEERLVEIRSPGGRRLFLTYDWPNDRIVMAVDDERRIVRYQYDEGGRLSQVINACGGATEYAYDAQHHLLTRKDARGIVFNRNTYDAAGRAVRQQYADGGVFQVDYFPGPEGRVVRTDTKNARGVRSRTWFDERGYLVRKVEALGRPEEQVHIYQRDPQTRTLLREIDPLGRAIDRIDEDGAEETEDRDQRPPVIDPLAHVRAIVRAVEAAPRVGDDIQYERDKCGRVIAAVDARGRRTSLEYDPNGNVVAVIAPDGGAHRFTYTVTDEIETYTAPDGTVERFEYDFATNRWTWMPGVGREWAFLPILVRHVAADGSVTRFEYDGLGRLVFTGLKERRRAGGKGGFERTIRLFYDAADRVVRVEDSKEGTQVFEYEARRPTSRTPASRGSRISD